PLAGEQRRDDEDEEEETEGRLRTSEVVRREMGLQWMLKPAISGELRAPGLIMPRRMKLHMKRFQKLTNTMVQVKAIRMPRKMNMDRDNILKMNMEIAAYFNVNDEHGLLSFLDIKNYTGIEDKELRQAPQSLACGKVQVLQKIPQGRDVEGKDEVVFNDDFSAPLYRIKLIYVLMGKCNSNERD
ncbi:hypothetical protein ACJX0J_025612, partial [Zea mays]